MEKINNFASELCVMELEKTVSSNGKVMVKQTKRNEIKKNLMPILKELVEKIFEDNDDVNVYRTKDGIEVGVYNESLDQEVVFVVDPSIRALGEKDGDDYMEYDAQLEEDMYAEEEAEKAVKRAKRVSKKKPEPVGEAS